MPRNFKTLANITVWILFIFGCLTILPIPFLGYNGTWTHSAVGIASLVLSVVTMKLRKSLD